MQDTIAKLIRHLQTHALATKDHIERKETMLFRPLPFLCDPSWQKRL